ncbi:hypothetical protein RUM44_012561 [Polyplax serrata]|uniref:Dynein light chain Tctex-type 1 n=1 Tax=Polyplax serrata TaxID=468196 RepID=A0ABR1BBM5_POLSC
MDGDVTCDDTKFVVDEVSVIIKEVIENTIGGNAYQQNKVGQWTSSVVESCLGSLAKLQKPYKYIGELEAICYMHNHAKDWSWTPHCQLMFLGQQHRWKLHSTLGEQNHVLPCFSLWSCNLIAD